MSIHSDSNFPISANDQADVIQIFLDLMSEGDYAPRAAEVATDQPVASCDDSSDLWYPSANEQ